MKSNGQILKFLHFFYILDFQAVSLAVRHDIFRPKPLQIAFLFLFRKSQEFSG